MVSWIFNGGGGEGGQGTLFTTHPSLPIPKHTGLGVRAQCSKRAHVPTSEPSPCLARVLIVPCSIPVTGVCVCARVCVHKSVVHQPYTPPRACHTFTLDRCPWPGSVNQDKPQVNLAVRDRLLLATVRGRDGREIYLTNHWPHLRMLPWARGESQISSTNSGLTCLTQRHP